MKKLLLLPILLIAISFASCSSEDDTTTGQTITGEWTLTGGSGTISGRIDEFAFGEITWTFHEDHTVDVVNTITDPDKLSGLPTGTYNYMINNSNEVEGCPKTVSVGTAIFGCASISSATIQIGDGFADGVGYTLVPMPQIIPF